MRRAIAALSACALLAGCTAAQATSRPVTLDVVMADDWETAPAVREVIRSFEREHEVRVQVQAAPFSQIPDLVRNAIDLGEPFDLAHWHAFAAGADGIAEPLDDLWIEHQLDPEAFLPGAVDGVTWQGTRYGLPLDVNALVLLVNDRKLRSAGLTPEDLADAEDFLEVARSIREQGDVDHAITLTASSWAAYGWIRAFGGDLLVLEDDGEVTFTFDDPRTVAAIETLGALASEELGTAPFAQDLALDSVAALTNGVVALHASGSWDLPITERAHRSDVGDITVLPLPRGSGDTGTVLGGSSLFVPLGAEHRDLAFAFALALTEDETGLRLAEEEGRLPARSALYEHPMFAASPERTAFVEELPEASVMPLIAFPELASAFSAALERVLKGQEDAGSALAGLQRVAEEIGPR
ncbi:sugar ABC transporter substrate-binding protein [Nitriliruptor alkaliphilus]|uniref:sugar ABC transporter substrate-binding protein n=1 Tax=Nitriliruptor alkaliphilus TaxID=427918 RepID=UPI00069766F8|nr:extracellular solute-binding protein [Nitriliruptor alkaliphilus]